MFYNNHIYKYSIYTSNMEGKEYLTFVLQTVILGLLFAMFGALLILTSLFPPMTKKALRLLRINLNMLDVAQ